MALPPVLGPAQSGRDESSAGSSHVARERSRRLWLLVLGEVGVLVSHVGFMLRLGASKAGLEYRTTSDPVSIGLGGEVALLLVALPAVWFMVHVAMAIEARVSSRLSTLASLCSVISVGILPALFLAVFLCGITYPLAVSALILPTAAWIGRRSKSLVMRATEVLGTILMASAWYFVDIIGSISAAASTLLSKR